jgi:hypothetical protein
MHVAAATESCSEFAKGKKTVLFDQPAQIHSGQAVRDNCMLYSVCGFHLFCACVLLELIRLSDRWIGSSYLDCCQHQANGAALHFAATRLPKAVQALAAAAAAATSNVCTSRVCLLLLHLVLLLLLLLLQLWQTTHSSLAARVQLVSGDMFEALSIPGPPSSDSVAYVLRNILHDW